MNGYAFDLTEGYDMNKRADRREAWRALETDEPKLLVGSPRCTPFSRLWTVFGGPWDPQKRHDLLKECEQHVRLCVQMYRFQMSCGRHFVHEHPFTSSSWEMKEVWELIEEPGVYFVEVDQCEAGAVLPSRADAAVEQPLQKHSGFLTSSPEIAKSLSKFRCRNRDAKDPRGKHIHTDMVGGKRSAMAQTYPP